MKRLISYLSSQSEQLPDDFVRALEQLKKGSNFEEDLFEALSNNSTPINEALYIEIRNYLHLKMFDQEPLTDSEERLVSFFPMLDEERIIKVKVTDKLIDKGAETPDSLTEDERHALSVVLTDRIIDGKEMSSYMLKALNAIQQLLPPSLETNSDNFNDLIQLEYGYDIFNLEAVQNRISQSDSNPLTQRERKMIERLHKINPDIGF